MADTLNRWTRALSTWETPASRYPEKEIRNVRIRRVLQKKGFYRMYGLKGYVFYRVDQPIPITELQEKKGKKWSTWMVDDPPHWEAMQIYGKEAKGRVVCAGLGLGLVQHVLAKNDQVTEVLVIERNGDVIRLIKPYTSGKIRIEQADWYDFLKTDQDEWDTMIVDLWVAHGGEEKMRLYYQEVLPMVAKMALRYPKAIKVFHGFVSVTDIRLVSDKMMDILKTLPV